MCKALQRYPSVPESRANEACHRPHPAGWPPPSDQIVHVRLRQPVQDVHSMDAIWVSGTLHAEHADSIMGASSCELDRVAVERYTRP